MRRKRLYINIRNHIVTCRGVCAWLIDGVLDWMIIFIDTLYTVFGTTGNYSAVTHLHTLQFTDTHVVGFSVFTSRILATDFITISLSHQITYEVFFSQPNSLLAISSQSSSTADSLSCISRCSQAHILAGWRLETQLSLLNWNHLYNHFASTTQKLQPLYCWEGVFTAPLHSNGSYSIVCVRVIVVAGMCLPSRCLAMNVYSDFTVPVFGHHVTI
jgi:hypothetical protein